MSRASIGRAMHLSVSPANVRVIAVSSALLVHLLALLLLSLERRASRREPELQLQRISIWPDPLPVRGILPAAGPQPSQMRPASSRSPAPSTAPDTAAAAQPLAPIAGQSDQGTSRSIDWSAEGRKSAERIAAGIDAPAGFSPPPPVQRQPCRPPQFDAATRQKMDALLPQPPEPARPADTSDSIMIGNIRVGVIGLARGLGARGEARGDLFDPAKQARRPPSSVPDPYTCD